MKYILSKSKSGLGNRILSLLTAILYGDLCGRRVLVDWDDGMYSEPGENAARDFFKDHTFGFFDDKFSYSSVYPRIWEGNLDKGMHWMFHRHTPGHDRNPFSYRKYSCDVSKLDYDEDVLVFWSYMHKIPHLRRHLNEQMKMLSSDEILAKLIKERIHLKDEILEEVESFKRENFSDFTIGVQVRYTQNRPASMKACKRAIADALSRHPGATIFLATDSEEAQKILAESFPRVIVTKKWFPTKVGAAMHMGSGCPDKKRLLFEAFIDLYLLAECDYLIYARSSTFSHCAYLLTKAPKERTVDLDRFDVGYHFRSFVHFNL